MGRSCKECVYHNPDFIDEVCLHCSWPEFAGEPSNFKPKPITNADRIRAMSDEELALYFAATFEVDAFDGTGNSYKKWLDWLRQEGENGKTD